jgi:hypothetical protein
MTTSSMTLTNGSGTSFVSNHTVEGFAFDDLASGDYTVSISGMLTGSSMLGTHFGFYDGGIKLVPQIPEPETFALMLAGLATLGAILRRRAKG